MDLKGITWMGHVYQKFEDMCLEVEEVMFQDTVKYVENQVQTVGASVKKLYSEVMQDVMNDFPPSCTMDTMKGESTFDLAMGKDGSEFKSPQEFRKPHTGFKEGNLNVDCDQLIDYSEATSDITDDSNLGSSIQGFHDVDSSFESTSGRSVKGYHLSLVKRRNRSMHNRYNQEYLTVSGVAPDSTYIKKELHGRSPLYEKLNENPSESHYQIYPTSTPVLAETEASASVESCVQSVNNCESIASISNHNLRSVDSIGRTEMEMRCFSDAEISEELNGNLSNVRMGSPAGSSIDGITNCDKSSEEVSLTSHPGGSDSDDWTTDAMESITGLEHGIDGTQQFQKRGIEESCVMVTGCELHHSGSLEGKRKKKIRNANFLRSKPSRKREYKLLATLHSDIAASNLKFKGTLMPNLSRKDTVISELESEWEVL